ncbi:MAG: homoserine dehydrogenase [Pseudomonadota bacterium]|jgi:homoserine dehydrogenase
MTGQQIPLRVGIAGLGTVGSGTYTVLTRNQAEIGRRTGRDLVVTAVADLDQAKAQALTQGRCRIYSNAIDLAQDPEVDVVVELVGGYGFAKTLVEAALAAGKPVVTANKALLALHGNTLFAQAQAAGVSIGYEASVAGGIPIMKSLREGLAANRIQSVAGIINGTTNFILSEMRAKGLSFEEVLAEAQRLGYAEADPTFDVEGIDAAHKITLLASNAFGIPLAFEQAHVEGIRGLQSADIRYAEQLGYRVKLLGITKRQRDGIELRVHPTLVPQSLLLANVEGAMNAVQVVGDAVGTTLHYGKGAGSEPTASAVISDLIDLSRLGQGSALPIPALGFQDSALKPLPILPIAQVTTGFYLRMGVRDEPGVLADITRRLADRGISIDAFIQRPREEPQDHTDVIIVTHPCVERDLRLAVAELVQLPTILEQTVTLRVEHFE